MKCKKLENKLDTLESTQIYDNGQEGLAEQKKRTVC